MFFTITNLVSSSEFTTSGVNLYREPISSRYNFVRTLTKSLDVTPPCQVEYPENEVIWDTLPQTCFGVSRILSGRVNLRRQE